MGRFLCVANAAENMISLIDTQTGKEEKSIRLQGAEKPLRLLVRGGLIYHADALSSTVGFIHLESGKQRLATVGACPGEMVLRGKSLFVCCRDAGSIWKSDGRSLQPRLCTGAGGLPVGLCGKGSRLISADFARRQLIKFDEELHTLQEEKIPYTPLCLEDGGNCLLCGVIGSQNTGRVLRLGDEEEQALSVKAFACSKIRRIPGKNLAAALHMGDGRLSLINYEEMETLWSTKTARLPDDLAVEPAAGRIYVSCMMDECIDVFSFGGKRLACWPAGREPRGLALFSGRE